MRNAWLQRWTKDLPSRCAVCGAWPARALCDACVAGFAAPRHRCGTCALPLPEGVATCGACLREPPPLDACYAAVAYAYPWSGLVARFKFGGEPGWAAALAERMAAVPGVREELARADLVLPVPLAPRRLAERGFNQALLLARALARDKTESQLLLRLRETGSQAALDRKARSANVRDAFGVEPLRAAEVKGRALVLVDDVMTSGASLHAAAAALRQAGAARVAAVVLARTAED
ncbi:ComF family protein [Ramlibacter sp. USB13]|uniref:ComF family protein n=1 Tax=Ramlibacter cellulosilyticus TaxID=2764187 RepID=A0A923SCV5_9BURK|nr:phosphoribosyltransferase family protein [Ramlibacter cellulosilyticus]MBC5785274.1 ComF family protein [Ramlibacter cellulosilyticus]